MIAASVDDLPEPVGPVTSTTPFFSAAVSPRTGGSFNSARVGMFEAMTRITMAYVPRWRKTLTRKRERCGSDYAKSQAPCSLSACGAWALSPIKSRAMRAVSAG